MEQAPFAFWLLPAALVCLGLYGLVRGEVRTGPEDGSPVEQVTLQGWRARTVSVVVLAAGVSLPISTTVGICLVVAAVLLAWLLSR